MSDHSEIIYEVTLYIDPEIIEEFDDWLAAHVGEMLDLPGFSGAQVYRLADDEHGHAVRVAHYELQSQAALDEYLADQAEAMRAKGVDTIACMAVNDVFVMDAWGKDRSVGDSVMMLADGNGDYAKALDLELDGSGFGMGQRGQRFAIIVDDGVATHVAVEAPGQFEVSKAESILSSL